MCRWWTETKSPESGVKSLESGIENRTPVFLALPESLWVGRRLNSSRLRLCRLMCGKAVPFRDEGKNEASAGFYARGIAPRGMDGAAGRKGTAFPHIGGRSPDAHASPNPQLEQLSTHNLSGSAVFYSFGFRLSTPDFRLQIKKGAAGRCVRRPLDPRIVKVQIRSRYDRQFERRAKQRSW
jgi:hypothetical protein